MILGSSGSLRLPSKTELYTNIRDTTDDNDSAVQYARKWTEDYGSRPDMQDMVPTSAYIAGGVNAVGESTANSLSEAMNMQIK